MKKFLKWFSLLAAAGAAIGLVIAYFCKSSDKENIEDDSELKDFDDIVIDDSANGAGEQDATDLDNAEKSEEGEEKPEEPSMPAEPTTPTSPDQE